MGGSGGNTLRRSLWVPESSRVPQACSPRIEEDAPRRLPFVSCTRGPRSRRHRRARRAATSGDSTISVLQPMHHSLHNNGVEHSASSETAGGFLKKSASAVSNAECSCHHGKRAVRSFTFPSTQTPSRKFGGGNRRYLLDGVPVDVIQQNSQESLENQSNSYFDVNFFDFWNQDVE